MPEDSSTKIAITLDAAAAPVQAAFKPSSNEK
jgi:hypothetical protein